jgi:two-component system response regulator YesN
MMHYFLRFKEYLIFNWNINTYGILVKGEADMMDTYVQRALQNITRIYTEVEQDYDWYVAAGTMVERLSQLTDCYNKVNHILTLRYLSPTDHVITEDTEEFAMSNDDSKLEKLDVNKVNPEIVKRFLENGLKSEVDDFVANYFLSLQEPLKSKLFRNYLVLNIRFVTLAYAESLGRSQEEFIRNADAETIPDFNSSLEDLKKYAHKLIMQAIVEREKENDDRSHTILKSALEYIEEKYTDETLSLNDVAAVIDVSPNYFSAIFSQEMGVTFIEYVTKKRMDKAKKLLRQSDMHTAEIAMEVGYKDPHYFSFVFKKTQGCTPREYRNS